MNYAIYHQREVTPLLQIWILWNFARLLNSSYIYNLPLSLLTNSEDCLSRLKMGHNSVRIKVCYPKVNQVIYFSVLTVSLFCSQNEVCILEKTEHIFLFSYYVGKKNGYVTTRTRYIWASKPWLPWFFNYATYSKRSIKGE